MNKEFIENQLDNPEELERLYRSQPAEFALAFQDWAAAAPEHPAFSFWKARLEYKPEASAQSKADWLWVFAAALLTGVLVRLPDIFDLDPDFFYSRNLALVVLPVLMAYFLRHTLKSQRSWMLPALGVLMATLYINFLPDDSNEDVFFLACLHLPLFLWSLTGLSFLGENWRNDRQRLEFLRFNGDVFIMATLVLQAGGLLSVITIGLFELIGVSIGDWYSQNVMVMGAAAIPVLSTHWVRNNPKMINRLSPLIARIFTPLVLITLSIYLVAMVYSASSLFEDREALLLFNLVLIGVLALILFSVVEVAQSASAKLQLNLLSALSVVTIAINALALSAIVYRIFEWGFTPNRLAVLGGNVLFIIHLVMVAKALISAARKGANLSGIESALVRFLPFYAGWTLVVTFLFPLIFWGGY